MLLVRRSIGVGPHIFNEQYYLLLIRVVFGWRPGLATHFGNGTRYMVASENYSPGQSGNVLVCAGCSERHPHCFSDYRKSVAPSVA